MAQIFTNIKEKRAYIATKVSAAQAADINDKSSEGSHGELKDTEIHEGCQNGNEKLNTQWQLLCKANRLSSICLDQVVIQKLSPPKNNDNDDQIN